MDLSSIKRLNNTENEVRFSGIRTVKDSKGDEYKRIWLPNYVDLEKDKDGLKEEMGIEIVRMVKETAPGAPYGWKISENAPIIRVEVDEDFKNGNKTYFDLDLKKYRMKNAGEFGYRFVVYNKDKSPLKEKTVKRAFSDNIATTVSTKRDGKDEQFTVASTNQGTVRTYGPMNHGFADAINSPVIKNVKTDNPDKEIAAHKKNHVNKLGGTIRGIIERIDVELGPYKYFMSTPLIGGGSVSSHSYHPKNPFHISEGFGDKNDFKDLNIKCFETGKGYVLDGAFTSQGYEGIQLNHALKWNGGKDVESPFKYWFKNPSDSGIVIGSLLDKSNEYTGVRIVNPKGAKDYKYDPTMPTYIQFYDTRLAGKQLEDSSKLITQYDRDNTDDPYEITTWHDAALTNYFEIDPNTPALKGKTYGSLAEWQEEGLLHDILSPQRGVQFDSRANNAGTTGWDGSIDLVKMNISNHSNSPALIEGSKQVKNQMYNIARFWTTETRNNLIMHVANQVHQKQGDKSNTSKMAKDTSDYLNSIEAKYHLDKGVLNEIYGRVLKEKDAKLYESLTFEKSYNYKIHDDKTNSNQAIQKGILNFPFETLNFSDELLAVLSTPYMTPRPTANGKADAGKLEVFEDAKNAAYDKHKTGPKLSKTMCEVYTETLPALVKNIMHDIQAAQIERTKQYGDMNPKLLYKGNGDSFGELTPYGRYFLEMAMGDIMNFLMTEALFSSQDICPNKDVNRYIKNKKGDLELLDYGYADKQLDTKGNGKRLNLNKLKISEATPENEAEALAKKLKKGLCNLETVKSDEIEEFEEYLSKKYCSLDPEDYKIAEAVIDQTGAGLNWRFDAAKDVADWDEAKEGTITAADAWDDVIECWKPFVNEIKKVNNSSYIVAEVTSLHDFDSLDWGKYGNADKAENTFFEEVAATTTSNYSTTFGLYPKFFGKNIENGAVENYASLSNFLSGLKNFTKPSADRGIAFIESIMGSHVFLGNHDKPRGAHLMGVDAQLFWSDFKADGKFNKEYVKRAEKVLNRSYADDMNSKAVAVAEKYLEFFEKEGKAAGLNDKQIKILTDSVSHLANGYKYCTRENKPNYAKAESFGATPFEITLIHVLEQAESMGLKLDINTEKRLFESIQADMTAPYRSKMPEIHDIMLGTFGIPTLFSGDEFAQTGSELCTKNWEIGCRNAVRYDWISDNKKEYITDFYNRIDAANKLNNDPRMNARITGAPTYIIPSLVDFTSKDGLIKTMEGIGNNSIADIKSACNFLKCDKNPNATVQDYINELKQMPENEVTSHIKERLNELSDENPGLCNWVKQNIHPDKKDTTETGAVVRNDEKGGSVITMITNAYLPKDPDTISGLLKPGENGIVAPKISSVVLKDEKGNLVAKPGSKYIRKTYDSKAAEYKDNGVFILQKDGTLKSETGEDATLDTMTAIFYKEPVPLYTPITRPVG